MEWVGGRGEGGIVSFVGFCTFRREFCLAGNSVKMTPDFHLVQFGHELSRTLGNPGKRDLRCSTKLVESSADSGGHTSYPFFKGRMW